MSQEKRELVWLITGTSRGFGRQLVHSALNRGDCVIATARSLDKMQEFAPTEKLRVMQLDVTDGFPSIKAKVDEAASCFGRIDVLVNNAGFGSKAVLEEGGSEILRQQFDTNFFGLFDMTNAVLPHMRARRSGTVVLIGSRSSWAPELPGAGAYVSSKVAVRVLGEALNTEIAQFGIRTLIVEPGGFRTSSSMSEPGGWYEDNRIADYDHTLADAKRGMAGAAEHFRGDPVKAMELLVDVVRGEGKAAGKAWPLYLPMGELADAAIRRKTGVMLEVLDQWRDAICDLDVDSKD
ncbi:NAD-P-binding protein [Pilatotrama ljubarskyi]|nr:NAD-P-binding protein [Pilatotrama ljubarskyi]